MNITLIGFMGTGKTTVGKQLAKRLGWQFVDVDALIQGRTKKTIPDIFAEHGEAVFRRLERREIRRVARGDEQVITTGGGAFVHAQNRRWLRATGPVICLRAAPRVILQRVRPTLSARPMLARAPALLPRIRQLMAQRAPAYAKADLVIDTSLLSVDDVVEQIWSTVSPWMAKSWQYLLAHREQLAQRYAGKYIAVLDDRIVAVGASHLQAYRGIRRPIPANREVAIYYIPVQPDAAVVR